MCRGPAFEKSRSEKKEASCHCTEVASSDWCAKLFAGFSIIIIPFRCVSIWIWNFRLGFVGHFVSVLRGMSCLVSAVGGIQGSFTQPKKRSLTQNQWISSQVCRVFGQVWLGFCCFFRFGWNKSEVYSTCSATWTFQQVQSEKQAYHVRTMMSRKFHTCIWDQKYRASPYHHWKVT